MKRLRWVFILFAVVLLNICFLYGFEPETSNPDGVVVKTPYLPSMHKDSRIFKSFGSIRVEDKKLVLNFETTVPCEQAEVFVGTYSPGDLRVPVYIKGFPARIVDPSGTRQEANIPLDNLFAFFKDKILDVCYRISVDAGVNKNAFYEGRFTYFVEHKKVLTIVGGPWIDCVTDHGAVISWDTDSFTTAKVLISRTEANVVQGRDCLEFSELKQAAHHELTVNNLEADTQYYYRVISSQDPCVVSSPVFHFRTASKQLKEFRFAAMTDSRQSAGGPLNGYNGVNLEVLRMLFIDLYKKDARLVIFPGDLITGYTSSTEDYSQQLWCWKQAIEPVGPYLPVYEGMGNHEACLDMYNDGSTYGVSQDKKGLDSAEALFAQAFVNPLNGPEPEGPDLPPYKENVYYFDYAQVRFITLNTNYWYGSHPEQYGGNLEAYMMQKQFAWLERVLKEAEESSSIRYIFIGTHEPIFPATTHTKDGMWYNGGIPEKNHGHDRSYIVKCRDRFWKLATAHKKVVAVIVGDEHNYVRMEITPETPVYLDGKANPEFSRPLPYIISGGAGAPLYSAEIGNIPWKNAVKKALTAHHYLLFTVSEQGVIMDCVSHTGTLLDSCVLR